MCPERAVQRGPGLVLPSTAVTCLPGPGRCPSSAPDLQFCPLGPIRDAVSCLLLPVRLTTPSEVDSHSTMTTTPSQVVV